MTEWHSTQILGVLAGRDMPTAQLREWLDAADTVIAADSGADRCREAGRIPDVVIGDLDSVSLETRSLVPKVLHIDDQDTTDAEKLFQYVESLGYRQLTVAGVEGDHLDHMLANLQLAARSSLAIRFALRQGVGYVVRESLTIEVAIGARVSLLPISDCPAAYLEGVRWPLTGEAISPTGWRSISNEATADRVAVRLSGGAALLVHAPV